MTLKTGSVFSLPFILLKTSRTHLGFAWVLSVISQREAYLAERKRKSFGESGRKEQCVKRRNPLIFSWKKGHCTSSFALPSVLYLHCALTETPKLLVLLTFVFKRASVCRRNQFCTYFAFLASCIFEHFPTLTIEDNSTLRTTWGTHTQLLQKVKTRRQYDALNW